jgi:hypothetical protein
MSKGIRVFLFEGKLADVKKQISVNDYIELLDEDFNEDSLVLTSLVSWGEEDENTLKIRKLFSKGSQFYDSCQEVAQSVALQLCLQINEITEETRKVLNIIKQLVAIHKRLEFPRKKRAKSSPPIDHPHIDQYALIWIEVGTILRESITLEEEIEAAFKYNEELFDHCDYFPQNIRLAREEYSRLPVPYASLPIEVQETDELPDGNYSRIDNFIIFKTKESFSQTFRKGLVFY